MIWWCFCVCVFSTLCLQVGNRLGFWGGFICFVSFIWCRLFAWLNHWLEQPFFIFYQHLWFVFLSLPQAFVVCSFFATGICVWSLSFMTFSAIGIHVRLFVFALLALVLGYWCISQFLVSCCVLAACHLHPWRFEQDFFPSWFPCGQPYKFRFEANPIWYSAITFTKSQSAHDTKWIGVTGAASKSACLNCTNLTHFHLTAGQFCGNSCIVMLWVACELLQSAAIQ